MQPILDGLRLDLIEPECAPPRNDIFAEVKHLLFPCRPGDLILARKISVLVHLRHCEKEGHACASNLLYGNIERWSVEFRQEPVALDFGLFPRNGALAFARADRFVLTHR